jgi:hypothetical protein
LWDLTSQGLVYTLGVVEAKVFRQTNQQLAHRSVTVEVHVLVFDASPKPFHKDVVIGLATTVHADGDCLAFHNVSEDFAGELAALVAVEYLGLAMLAQGVFQAAQAEGRFHAVADIRRLSISSISANTTALRFGVDRSA